MISVFGSSRPGVEVETTQLGKPDHVGFLAGHDHHSGALRRKPNLDRLERRVLISPLVIDRGDFDALHVALEHRGTAEDPTDGALSDHYEVIYDIELGPPLLGK